MTFRSRRAVLATILLVACLLRGYSFISNTRAYGDVAWMSISAQQYLTSSTIRFPWTVAPFTNTLDDPLAAPAYWHGPAYPFLGGMVARILGTTDTFIALKLLGFASGMALVAVVYQFCRARISEQAAWMAALWVAVSPVLVDFSANGSPYIFSALMLTVLSAAFARFNFERIRSYVVLAAICAVGFQLHPAMLTLTLVTILFAAFNIRQLRSTGIAVFALTWLALFSPSLIWYLTYFERPYVSQQFYYIATELNLTGKQRRPLFANPALLITPPYLELYLRSMFARGLGFARNMIFELGLPVLVFALASGARMIFSARHILALQIIMPRLVYLGFTAMGLALLHPRFLVPVIPALLILAAFGIDWLTVGRNATVRRIAAAIAIGYGGWCVWSYLTQDVPPARYYRSEASINRDYDILTEIGQQLRVKGVGGATLLTCTDGYWLAYYVDIRIVNHACAQPAEAIASQLEKPELNVHYVLLTDAQSASALENYPAAEVVASAGTLAIYDLFPAD